MTDNTDRPREFSEAAVLVVTAALMELAYQAGVRGLPLKQLGITVNLPDVFRVLTLGANDVLAEKPDVPVDELIAALLSGLSVGGLLHWMKDEPGAQVPGGKVHWPAAVFCLIFLISLQVEWFTGKMCCWSGLRSAGIINIPISAAPGASTGKT